jgi:hypothetical protein
MALQCWRTSKAAAHRAAFGRKRLIMLKTKLLRRTFAVTVVGAAFTFSGTLLAQDTANVPKYPNPVALAESNAKAIVSLMDTDKNGKISKQEWMNFMSAEFDRMDVDKSGELDPHELLASRISLHHIPPSVQGK